MTDSKDWGPHVDTVSASIGLAIAPEYRQGVIENFTRIATVAQAFLTVPLEDEVEPAPRFEP